MAQNGRKMTVSHFYWSQYRAHRLFRERNAIFSGGGDDYNLWPSIYTMGHPMFIYQTGRNNPSLHKGLKLTEHFFAFWHQFGYRVAFSDIFLNLQKRNRCKGWADLCFIGGSRGGSSPPLKITASNPMGNDSSPGSQHNVWRHHNLGFSNELETVIRKIQTLKILCQFWLSASIKKIWIKIAEETWWNYIFQMLKGR